MSTEILINKFEALTKMEKKEVLDFIEFLKSKNILKKRHRWTSITKLEDEKFIGIWQNRDDMKDSTDWVRNIRTKDWG
ncbi:MAG: DUF2281 domain-containing protein [Actinobacteria bacterium]|nr:DUF2281 domain-containing protein [Actinomycetota bacterium]